MDAFFKRVIIENVQPEIDHGRFPVRRAAGETVRVTADVFADGHDRIGAVLCHRRAGETHWVQTAMTPLGNDRWEGRFRVDGPGEYEYTVRAWVDRFATWSGRLRQRMAAGQDPSLDLTEMAALAAAAADQADLAGNERLAWYARQLQNGAPVADRVQTALSPELADLMASRPDPTQETVYGKRLRVRVERPLGRFSTWYELFPRSCAPEPGRHGTFQDVIRRLPYIAGMGFDVLYLPPIHPIGRQHRKGRNNTPAAGSADPGSPWAIGAAEGGHTGVHPQLGTLADFQQLMAAARDHGIEIALDLAFQCSPDHPYVSAHPEWFRRRPDGTIQYAENPPKKYQDIYPLDFEGTQAPEMAEALLGVVRFWLDQGVRIFRVDNPHTKPLRFWEWLIGEVKRLHPDTIFLAEAFTRPRTMYRLAKGGFTQSYTYFTWRNLKWEIEQYFKVLTTPPANEFFWPNLWPNTPDILPEYLQTGGRAAFIIRLVLAATLSSSYGIYGPAFELCVDQPRESFSEEYLDSEKYQLRHWDWDAPESLKDFITRVNRIRRTNPALQQNSNLQFHAVAQEAMLCYTKHTDDLTNIVLVVVNLDPHHAHAASVRLPLEALGLAAEQPFQVHDLIRDARYLWHAGENYVALDPRSVPAHIFRIRRKVRTEHDFDYYM
ncbi:alpha-1,4-glucan--maltose-1-phosphate maltosyltransferase [Desulfatitalea alkaliphila]|uniref:Alpha-1,4-glucan:maltose-1-phosphate maltosyltransferase n=1 Tax=Desulfatitalea alkaliphila TaxID=2929485 RepID=A0AA41ULV9_9BACT|nr:alpha-1,4-glucan--maltose-1-phosphate maltosyltransferase [Desulfatitalea alkaliphila]MCJ8501961.1 alpha-1,4-glucan--maltose-1-phosphate maltosyltransferase [Desulfatitalea alkaliphila]